MSETDPGPLSTPNMEHTVTIINGSPYMPHISAIYGSPILLQGISETFSSRVQK